MATIPLRQKGSLDVALLRSKLEAHQRQLEAAQAHRERRHAIKKGVYVPRSAAAHFTVTTTPAVMASRSFEPQRRSSLPAIHVQAHHDRLATTDETSRAAGRRFDLDLGREDPIRRFLLEEIEDSPMRSPECREGGRDEEEEEEEEKEEEEKPRDDLPDANTKHRTEPKFPPIDTLSPPPTSLQPGPLNQPPQRRKSDTPVAPETRRIEPLVHRHPAMYNRPDWAQKSQNGDESSVHLLHLPRLGNLPPQMLSRGRFREREQHLVADAVRIIQEEERRERRRSFVGFFRKR